MHNFLFSKKYYDIQLIKNFTILKLSILHFSNCEKQFHNSIGARLITFNGAL